MKLVELQVFPRPVMEKMFTEVAALADDPVLNESGKTEEEANAIFLAKLRELVAAAPRTTIAVDADRIQQVEEASARLGMDIGGTLIYVKDSPNFIWTPDDISSILKRIKEA